MISTEQRFRGALLGLACGDAVGTSVEFSPRGTFPPVTDMRGGGPFALQPGEWTDDTSMALCLGESLLQKGFDPHDQMVRYLNWSEHGYFSCIGTCFDIGLTVARALQQFKVTGNPYAGSSSPNSAGNGALMRLVPVVLFGFAQPHALAKLAADSTRTTHGAAEAIEASQLFALLLHRALSGVDKAALFDPPQQPWYEAKVQALASAAWRAKSYQQLCGSGYCIASLEAALWCFMHTDSFEAAILAAVNLGDDADTTAAICGQIAGAYYGVEGIPAKWLELLALRGEIDEMARHLYARQAAGG